MKVLFKNNRPHNPPVSRSFTLIELLVLFGMAAMTMVGAKVLPNYIDGRFGWLLGSFAGFLLIPACAALWFLFRALVRDGIPMLPSCRHGCCRGSDYELSRFDEEFYWVCKCGDRYTRRGRLFLQVIDKGETIPCRTWRPFRGWFPAG